MPSSLPYFLWQINNNNGVYRVPFLKWALGTHNKQKTNTGGYKMSHHHQHPQHWPHNHHPSISTTTIMATPPLVDGQTLVVVSLRGLRLISTDPTLPSAPSTSSPQPPPPTTIPTITIISTTTIMTTPPSMDGQTLAVVSLRGLQLVGYTDRSHITIRTLNIIPTTATTIHQPPPSVPPWWRHHRWMDRPWL